MKNNTISVGSYLYLIGILFSSFSFSLTPIDFEDYGSGLGVLSVQNSDSTRDNISVFANTYSITLRDYSGTSHSSTYSSISITGNGVSILGDGSNTPSILDHTDFGNVQIVSETKTNTFTIHNLGGSDLTLGTISLIGSNNFTMVSNPSPGTILGIGESADVLISYNSNTQAVDTTLLTVLSTGNLGEETFTINLSATGTLVFFDSDNDGVFDDVDIDDDNDGILDSDEETNCRLSNSASTVDYKFLNETFGTGTTRGSGISSLYSVYTNYCLEDGISGSTCSESDPGIGDGEYTVSSLITTETSGEPVGPTGDAIASWAWYAWAPLEDHTPNDTDGRMAIFNASYAPGVFYETEIKGTIANVPISYSFWVANIDEPDTNFIAQEYGGDPSTFTHRGLPNVTVNFWSSDKSILIASFNTGDITRCGDAFVSSDHTGTYPHAADATYSTCETSVWQNFSQNFSTPENSFIVQFVNNASGGVGNDLAIDDIEVRQTLCDTDNDSVADVFDLDSDNDGIPDVVEANPTSASLSEGKANLTDILGWVDANDNGMHDSLESLSPVDSDSDGIPDYLDLDSDNDGLYDVDESGVINANDATYQNGDGDINGDGTGDGLETELFREKDSDGNGSIEYYGDGILDTFDFHDGNTSYQNSYGNNSQGTAPLYALDSDSDGIPDYKDPYNNVTSTYDIDTVEIYAHLPNTAGVLDNTIDFDGDGIMASRDGDDTIFGSPRNLDLSYSLYFDGRNDYVEDVNVMASGDGTLMAFIKPDGANTNNDNQIIAGQDDFHIIIDNATKMVSAVVEGTTITSSTPLTDGIWTHVAFTTTSASGGETILYINGIAEATAAMGGISADATHFMIGSAKGNSNYFKGEIDEVRVFNASLTSEELKRMVYQELDDANGFNSGKIIPINISASLGNHLIKYYKMDGYQDDILDDKKSSAIDVTGAKMYNFKNIYFQKAPLPYVTIADGDWTTSTNWLHGNEWDITSKQDHPDDASIVHLKNNINLNGPYNSQGMVGLIVDSGKKFVVEPDKGLYNSWYLKLNGQIDLEGESQLVQTNNSIFDASSTGTLQRDQQGYSNTYLYNYWSSPVSPKSNARYTVPSVISNVSFLTSGYNGTSSPVGVADYWIWKYTNKLSNIYSEWQHVRSSGTIKPGVGFTMKGPGTGAPEQNYIFEGQPNNGDFNLAINANNAYLVGNPYPSALDANQFILDNISTLDGGNNETNVINGALYFWDHFAVNSHNLGNYQGGYAVYTLMGGTVAISTDSRINGTSASGTKLPERYIAVGQGFFVSADNGGVTGLTQPIVDGDLNFNNGQRVFQKEIVSNNNTGSSFFKTSKKSKGEAKTEIDIRKKIRLTFYSPDGFHRNLLIGVDKNATINFDLGYDAVLIEDNKEDMYWNLENSKLLIQAIDNFNEAQKIPFSMKIAKSGLAVVSINELENIDANKNIFVHDIELNTFHNLRESDFSVSLAPGEYKDRFEITFSNNASLSIEAFVELGLEVYFSNNLESLIINNPKSISIKSIEMLNILGQALFKLEPNNNNNHLEYKASQIKAGNYILKIDTEFGMISKKVLIE
ncbi:LamG-like jellyroll fold domain-containing protein [Algibacter sp.]|uniref:LamG-like jellyroll fold domain-containing protein n=1 Tax=Algibacter sp. TaxID=1872428 RepID=UPI003C77EBC5